MIVKLVSYQLPGEMTREEVMSAAQDVAREWLEHPNLVRKDFLLDENNVTCGVYLFTDRKSAEQAHGTEFLQRLEERFGVRPKIKYYDWLMTADVEQGEIRQSDKTV